MEIVTGRKARRLRSGAFSSVDYLFLSDFSMNIEQHQPGTSHYGELLLLTIIFSYEASVLFYPHVVMIPSSADSNSTPYSKNQALTRGKKASHQLRTSRYQTFGSHHSAAFLKFLLKA